MVVNRPRTAAVGPQHQRPLPRPSLKRRTLSRRQLAGARPGEHQAINAGVEASAEQERLGLLPAGSLNPQKARVLLLLVVLAGWDRDQLDALITASP